MKPCDRCGDSPRWRSSIWCRRCIALACCIPLFRRRKVCIHDDQKNAVEEYS